MIFNSFKYSRISNSLDESEDNQFREYENIEKGNDIAKIENDDKLYLDELLYCKQLFRWIIIFIKY